MMEYFRCIDNGLLVNNYIWVRAHIKVQNFYA